MLAPVMVAAREIQSPLRVKDILPPGFIEADSDIVDVLFQGDFAGAGEPPGSQKSRTAGHIQFVEGHRGG